MHGSIAVREKSHAAILAYSIMFGVRWTIKLETLKMTANRDYDLIFDPDHWGKSGAPHDVLSTLRKENPVFRYKHPRFQPVWLLTKRRDIEYVGKNPERFQNRQRTVIHNDQGYQSPLKGLPHMDPPEHPKHRRAMQSWFTPRAIRSLEKRMQ